MIHLVKVGFSSMTFDQKPEDGSPVWTQISDSFRNMEVTLAEFAGEVLEGRPFTCWLRGEEGKAMRRKEANYLLRQELTLDFDKGGVTVESLKGDELARKYSTYAYPTLSNTEDDPRTRLVFCLDRPIHQPANYRRAVEALQFFYGDADPSCKDAARFYFGAGFGAGVQSPWFNNRVLPLEVVKDLIKAHETVRFERGEKAAETKAQATEGYHHPEGLLRFWEDRVSAAGKGERNNTLVQAAYALGMAVRDGALRTQDVENVLEYAGQVCGLGVQEVRRTIQSGLTGALKS